MKAIRIVNALPSFFEIYSLFLRKPTTRYVFVDSYYFREDQLPSEAEWKIIDNQQSQIDNQIMLTPALIEQFAPRFMVKANCIHVYDHVPNVVQNEYLLFKSLNWDWAYHCYDDSVIEIFIRNNHEESFKSIKAKFNCEDIEFPGLIPSGLNILGNYKP